MKSIKTIAVIAALGLLCLNGESQNITPISELNREPSTPGSHFGLTSGSSLELDYHTHTIIGKDVLGWRNLHYPRIKKLADGTFIMLYQAARISKTILCAHSKDGINWTKSGKVFTQEKTINGYGNQDLICYSSADAIVLKNGDILAFSPFRTEKGYKMIPSDNGIAMVRSKDGGHTWEDYQIIYKSQTWEPYAMELDSGEIQVYFTDSDPHIKGASAGVSILRSFDGGYTWTQQCYISRHFKGMSIDQNNNSSAPSYCDQMPSVCLLGDGKTKFMAMESVHYENNDVNTKKTYMLSFVWNDDNWADTVKVTGPDKGKEIHAFKGCAPYVGYFPSGETILSYNSKHFHFRVGNEQADNFAKVPVYTPFGEGIGYWGSFELLDDHSLIAAVPRQYDESHKFHKIESGRFYLNHMIEVNGMKPRVDGNENDWEDNTDALFVGSEGQAQSTFRFAQDRKNIYVLVGLLDNNMLEGDEIRLQFCNGKSTESKFEIKLPYNSSSVIMPDVADSKMAAIHHTGTGLVAELKIAKKSLPLDGNHLYFNAVISKHTEGYVDSFTNVHADKPDTWIPLIF